MANSTVVSAMDDDAETDEAPEEGEELHVEISTDSQHDATFVPKPLIADDTFSLASVTDADPQQYPESYRSNSKREELVLTYIENFRQQYHHIYRNRKPLLLCPMNECRITKFVCTTVRPTMLPYSDLTDWKLTADFLADHLDYDQLDPPHELPRILRSPTSILAEQRGNCFDYANLLCSLLLGAGYDAYVVSGYATREICYMDTTRLPNPYSKKRQETPVEQLLSRCKKYAVKPTKDFTSKYDAYMQQRHLDAIRAEKDRIQDEENRRIAEIEKPLYDPLCGIRIHAWVLILPGKRDISEAFYIEPTTGYNKETNDREYLGIESLWNDQNYWVNMQDCSDGCESLHFGLNDQARWECVFPHSANLTDYRTVATEDDEEQLTRKRPLVILSNQIDWFDRTKFYFSNPLHLPVSNVNAISYYRHYPENIKSDIDKRYYTPFVPDITTKETVLGDFDLPLSWVDPLDITPQKFQKRYPNAHKKCYFKKTCVEKYAPYSMKDGLVLKVSEFADYDQFVYVTYWYEHRYDKLDIREHDVKKNTICEKYRPGRNDHLKEYIYNFDSSFDRTMIYYHKSRLDSLSERHERPNELTDYYIDHDQLLLSRKAAFEPPSRNVGVVQRETRRSIISISETFNRNLSLDPNDDVQELSYAIKDKKFIITYHRDVRCITPSVRTYIKSPNWNDKTVAPKWHDELTRIFQPDEDVKPMSYRDLYLKMKRLIEEEEEAVKQVRKAENEIRDLQSRRHQEELASDLEVSIYDTDRNEKSKVYEDLLKQRTELNEDADELDYLAPYLVALGNPKRIDAQIAEQLRYMVELNFKNRSVQRANSIQSRYEREFAELLARQQTEREQQLPTAPNDELQCEQAKFRLEILQERLKQHRQASHRQYLELQQKLSEDARLKEPYIVR